MKRFSLEQLQTLAQHAASAAYAAGQTIRKFDRSRLQVNEKTGGESLASQVVTQVDIACEAQIKRLLRPASEPFDIALLSEETADEFSPDTHPRLTSEYFWCIDPLDGTLPFVLNQSGYAVSIALVSRLGDPQLGVIYLPASDTLYQAISHPQQTSLSKNGVAWTPLSKQAVQSNTLRLFADRSFAKQQIFETITAALQHKIRRKGINDVAVSSDAGAVVNALSVLERVPGCYFKFPKPQAGGGSLWDFAATACIVHAAGGWVSDIHGHPLDLNRADSNFMNHRGVIFASSEAVAQAIMAVFSEHCSVE